ncbi:MAG: hypothetical protein HC919_09765, partial [Oscillatoriales cyanobacterium SM2_2_1]|nr:hypothetical protein [Oscillatoriales cyanobacterium SM2_2_1]
MAELIWLAGTLALGASSLLVVIFAALPPLEAMVLFWPILWLQMTVVVVGLGAMGALNPGSLGLGGIVVAIFVGITAFLTLGRRWDWGTLRADAQS